MAGAKTIVKFNDIDKLEGTLINKAELTIYVADLPNLNGTYPPPQLIASRKIALENWK